MGALKTFFGLCALFAAWLFVGLLNLALLRNQSFPDSLAVVILIIWLLSGPLWAILFLHWRGKRFSRAFLKMQEKLLRETQARLKNHRP